MYVCICKAVTDREIRKAAARGAGNLYELQDELGIAMGCGSCADMAEAILEETNARVQEPRLYVPATA